MSSMHKEDVTWMLQVTMYVFMHIAVLKRSYLGFLSITKKSYVKNNFNNTDSHPQGILRVPETIATLKKIEQTTGKR
mgnify:CR=1 FL=1